MMTTRCYRCHYFKMLTTCSRVKRTWPLIQSALFQLTRRQFFDSRATIRSKMLLNKIILIFVASAILKCQGKFVRDVLVKITFDREADADSSMKQLLTFTSFKVLSINQLGCSGFTKAFGQSSLINGSVFNRYHVNSSTANTPTSQIVHY